MTVMTQAYIIIDMQNDFIDGALGSAQAQAVVPRIEAKIVASKKDADQETDPDLSPRHHDEAFHSETPGRPETSCSTLPERHAGWRTANSSCRTIMWATILKSHPLAVRPWSMKYATTTGWY